MIHETAAKLLRLLDDGQATSVDITSAYLKQITEHDQRVGAFLSVNESAALEQAELVDAKRAKGETLGKLAGLPVAVKDVLCTDGELTTCGS